MEALKWNQIIELNLQDETINICFCLITLKIRAVMVGFDQDISYLKIARAMTILKTNPDYLFITTNTDATFPVNGRLYPGKSRHT